MKGPVIESRDRAFEAIRRGVENPGSAKSDRETVFTMRDNEAGSVILRWEVAGRLLPGVSAGGFDAWRVGPLDRDDAFHLEFRAGDVIRTVSVSVLGTNQFGQAGNGRTCPWRCGLGLPVSRGSWAGAVRRRSRRPAGQGHERQRCSDSRGFDTRVDEDRPAFEGGAEATRVDDPVVAVLVGPGSDRLGERSLRPAHAAQVDVGQPELVKCRAEDRSKRRERFERSDIQPTAGSQAECHDTAGPQETRRDGADDVGWIARLGQQLKRWAEGGQRLCKARGALARGIQHAEPSRKIVEAT